MPRLDLPAKSDGSLRFAGDVRTAFPDGIPPPEPEKKDDDKKDQAGAPDAAAASASVTRATLASDGGAATAARAGTPDTAWRSDKRDTELSAAGPSNTWYSPSMCG